MTENKPMDKLLAVIFAITILAGFGFVYLVSASFENGVDTVDLYTTDSNAEFGTLEFVDAPVNTWQHYTTGYNQVIDYANYTKTPVYTGNDTWAISINGSANPITQFSLFVIELPELDNWIINNIIVNSSINTDSDLLMIGTITSTPTLNTVPHADYLQHTNVFIDDDTVGTSTDYHNETYTITLAKALNIYENAQNGDKHFLVIQIFDDNADGFNGWGWDLRVSINGTQTSTYNLPDQISMAIGLSAGLNILVGLYMTDTIDLGGTKNDIPDKRRK